MPQKPSKNSFLDVEGLSRLCSEIYDDIGSRLIKNYIACLPNIYNDVYTSVLSFISCLTGVTQLHLLNHHQHGVSANNSAEIEEICEIMYLLSCSSLVFVPSWGFSFLFSGK